MSKQLQVNQLNWRINDKSILQNISFDVNRREIIGIIGPNGAGKTSLLRCITNQVNGARHASMSGDIYLNHKSISGYSAKKLAQHFAVVAQKSEPIFSLSVIDIVKMGLLPHQSLFAIDSDYDKEQIQLALKKVGLTTASNKRYHQLSGGEQQRVLIARALVQKAQILILDEPTNHLDVYYQHQILQLITQLNITVIMTVHDLNLASQYCQRLLLLNEGQLIADGTPKSVLTEEQLSQVFKLDCAVELMNKSTNKNTQQNTTPRVFFSLPVPVKSDANLGATHD